MAATATRTIRRRPRQRLKSGTPERIYRYRVSNGLSPERFGSRVGLSGMTIRRIEDGRAKASALLPRTKFLIAQEMNVEVDDLWPM